MTRKAAFETDESYHGLEQERLVKQILSAPLVPGTGERFTCNADCSYPLGGIIYTNTGQLVLPDEKSGDPDEFHNIQGKDSIGRRRHGC